MNNFKKNILHSIVATLALTSLPTAAKVTLSMCVKNEADHYLPMILQEVRHYIDEAVFIDDASTDNTVQVIYEVLQGIPVHIIHNPVSKFSNEVNLRKQQWQETIKTNPEWILNIDADQVFELAMRTEIKKLTEQDQIDVWLFRLYDFWDMDHYRDDNYWAAHNTYRSFLMRYKKDFNYVWKETPQHCGHFPMNILSLPNARSEMRLKHFGWANEQDRLAKYKRYQKLDPGAKYGWHEQYESILDPNPHLVKWIESDTKSILFGKRENPAWLNTLKKIQSLPINTVQIKQIIKELLPENPVILEAGAHEGGDTIQMAQLWPQGTLYAFEPVPGIFEKLKLKTRGCPNIHAFQLALNDTTGITKFYLSSGDSDCSSSLLEPKEHLKYHPTVYFKNYIDVQTMNLDEWAEKNNVERIDFMWLDMQGSELAVLKASPKMLATVSVIYTEVNFCEAYKGCPLYPELRAWLESQGFVVAHEDLKRWVDFGDVLFLRKNN